MGVKRRAISVTAAAIVNGTLGVNSALLLTIEESVFDTGDDTLTETIASGPIIPLDQLSYSLNYNEDEPNVCNLLIKNGDVDVLVINGQDYDPSDESDWIYDKCFDLFNQIYSIHQN